MTAPLDFLVKQAIDSLDRVTARYLPSWEGGAAVAAREAITRLKKRVDELERMINTPHTDDFVDSVKMEAAHQQMRWGTDDDAGKQPTDWYWLLGHLAGKSVAAFLRGDRSKGLHHIVSSAAALLNWYRHVTGDIKAMRPGIADPEDKP